MIKLSTEQMAFFLAMTSKEAGFRPLKDRKDLPYRPTAKAILIDQKGNLVAKVNPSYVKLPGGGIDEGEDPEKALRRELKEETGLKVGDLKLHCRTKWDWPDDFPNSPKRKERYAQFRGEDQYTFIGKVVSEGKPTSKEGDAWDSIPSTQVDKVLKALKKKNKDYAKRNKAQLSAVVDAKEMIEEAKPLSKAAMLFLITKQAAPKLDRSTVAEAYDILNDAEEVKEKAKPKPSILKPALLTGGGLAAALLARYSMSPEDYRKYQSFASIDSNIKDKDDSIRFLNDYSNRGHEAMNSHLFGEDATKVIKWFRTLPKSPYPWEKGDDEHYADFKKSPAAGMAARVKEVTEAELGNPTYNEEHEQEIKDKVKWLMKEDMPDVSDTTLKEVTGRRAKTGYDTYQAFLNGILNARNVALYGGAATAGIGGGLLLSNLIKRHKANKNKIKEQKLLKNTARRLVAQIS